MRNYRSYYLATAAACVLSCAANAQNRCTQWTVTGTYALAYDGAMIMKPAGAAQPVTLPGAGLAIVSIDTEGAISSAGYQTIGGTMAYTPAMPGALKVNADCTGTLVWTGGATATVVVSEGGDEIDSLVIQSPMGAAVVRGTWRRISRVPNSVYPSTCSPTSVFGTYTLSARGYVMATAPGALQPSLAPIASVGVASVARDGGMEGSGTVVIAGQPMPATMAGGTMQMKPDCTGTMAATAVSQGRTLGQNRSWFIALDGGDTLWIIDVSSPLGSPITLGVAKRISHTTAGGQ